MCLDKSDFKWVFGIVKDEEGNMSSTDQTTQPIVEKLKTLSATRKSKESEFINKYHHFTTGTCASRIWQSRRKCRLICSYLTRNIRRERFCGTRIDSLLSVSSFIQVSAISTLQQDTKGAPIL